jgi:SdpC family antimicrobial peptide
MKSIIQATLVGIGLAFALSACGGTALETSDSAATVRTAAVLKNPTLDGQAIFRGLLFGEQTLGELLPSVWRGRSLHDLAPGTAERDSSLKEINAFTRDFEAANPKFFAGLSKSMRSGNPLQVQTALADIGQAVQVMFPSDGDEDLSGNTALRIFIYRNRFIYKNKVVASNRYIMPYKYIKVYVSALTEDDTPIARLIGADNFKSLEHETLVADLTKRLAL